MFDNIQDTIKSIAKFLFWLSVTLAIIWAVIIIDTNAKLNVRYKYYTFSLILSLIEPIALFFGGAISSFVLYGLGEIIELLKNINNRLNNKNDANR